LHCSAVIIERLGKTTKGVLVLLSAVVFYFYFYVRVSSFIFFLRKLYAFLGISNRIANHDRSEVDRGEEFVKEKFRC